MAKFTLAIIDEHGEVHTVVDTDGEVLDNLEEFNLSKTMARAFIADAVDYTVEFLKNHEEK